MCTLAQWTGTTTVSYDETRSILGTSYSLSRVSSDLLTLSLRRDFECKLRPLSDAKGFELRDYRDPILNPFELADRWQAEASDKVALETESKIKIGSSIKLRSEVDQKSIRIQNLDLTDFISRLALKLGR